MGDTHNSKRDNEFNLDIVENISHRQRSTHCFSNPCEQGCSKWCSKYFWEGQSLNKQQQQALLNISDDAPWHVRVLVKHRRLLGLVIPAVFFHFCWWGIAIKHDLWHIFQDKYYMSITMVFGSMIAGMTSEGGGAVAFPVMTLAFGIKPMVARDFSLMIQSCGMTAAAFTIFFMKVQLEWNALVSCSLGGMFGMIFGLYLVDPVLKPAHKKMAFVCIWFSFAFALFLLNRYRKRRTFKAMPQLKVWKILVLLATGFMGGIFSSFAGSGLDICTFSVITLLFRVTEKTATPTSVVLMAGNTVVGFYWRQVMMMDVSDDAWQYFAVCVPVVVIGAPLGSVIGSHFHRQVLAALIYLLDTIALITAFIIVPQTPVLACVSVGIILIGFGFFFLLTVLGNKVLAGISENQKLSDPISYKATISNGHKESPSSNKEKVEDSVCSV